MMSLTMPACGDDDDDQATADPFETSYWESMEVNSKKKPLITVQFMPQRLCEVNLYFFSNDQPKKIEMKYTRQNEKLSLIQSSGAYAYGFISGDTIHLSIGNEPYTLLQKE